MQTKGDYIMEIAVKAKDSYLIQTLMIKKGLVKNTLANKAAVHPNTVKKLFDNKYIRAMSAKKICDALEIDENNYDNYFVIEYVNKSIR